jgi:predicted RNase H-like HicB family nuclease
VQSPQTVPAEVLAALANAFSDLRARWYLFGAQAAIAWGRPRLTADIDVTGRLEPEDPERLVRTLIEKAGRNYSAYAPDLPGVITTGPTPEATERKMRDAIAFHVSELRAAGDPIPVPTARATCIAAR